MKPVIVEQAFNIEKDKVWAAITEHDQMVQWFFENIPSFEARVGFKTSFNVSNEDRNFLHMWEILEVEEGKKIVYDWRYKEWEGEGKVIFEIEETDSGCKLTVTNHGIETFTADIPEFGHESCEGGWNYFVRERLKDYLG